MEADVCALLVTDVCTPSLSLDEVPWKGPPVEKCNDAIRQQSLGTVGISLGPAGVGTERLQDRTPPRGVVLSHS